MLQSQYTVETLLNPAIKVSLVRSKLSEHCYDHMCQNTLRKGVQSDIFMLLNQNFNSAEWTRQHGKLLC